MMSSCSASFYSQHEKKDVIYFLMAVLRLQPLLGCFISDSSGQICLSRSLTDIFILGQISVHQLVFFSRAAGCLNSRVSAAVVRTDLERLSSVEEKLRNQRRRRCLHFDVCCLA